MNSKNILPFALAGVAGMSLQTAMAQEKDERPNIILFLVDDMG